MADFLITLCCT